MVKAVHVGPEFVGGYFRPLGHPKDGIGPFQIAQGFDVIVKEQGVEFELIGQIAVLDGTVPRPDRAFISADRKPAFLMR